MRPSCSTMLLRSHAAPLPPLTAPLSQQLAWLHAPALHSHHHHGGSPASSIGISQGRRGRPHRVPAAAATDSGASAGQEQCSQDTARAAQAVVEQANGYVQARASSDTQQGLILLGLAAAVWAATRRQALLAAVSQIALPDLFASALFIAAIVRMLPNRARMGAAHVAAVLQSVFLLGSIAMDIAQVKNDIGKLRTSMQGLSARAAWVPPRRTDLERQQERQQKQQERLRKRDAAPPNIHTA